METTMTETTPTTLPYRLERTVAIQASPETVFRFFTDSARWASWWGAGSTIDARPGGRFLIRYPGGVEALGEVLEISAPERLVLSYGYAAGTPVPPGGSRVSIRLTKDGARTVLHLTHELADAAARDEHIQGWRYQLSLFGNLVADEVFAGAAALVDAWFRGWSEEQAEARQHAFATITTPDVRFSDRFSLILGLDELVAHIGGYQRVMPGIRLERRGDIRQCQGTVLAEWIGVGRQGEERMNGTNVFLLAPTGRIESVTGFITLPRTAQT
jgi:uncharacterized protein YndB with AHSA1/START domain